MICIYLVISDQIFFIYVHYNPFSFRCFLGSGAGPAQWPDANRYMKVLITKLLSSVQSPVKQKSKTIQRYSVVCQLYRDIRRKIVDNSFVMDNTNIMLLDINQKLLVLLTKRRLLLRG